MYYFERVVDVVKGKKKNIECSFHPLTSNGEYWDDDVSVELTEVLGPHGKAEVNCEINRYGNILRRDSQPPKMLTEDINRGEDERVASS